MLQFQKSQKSERKQALEQKLAKADETRMSYLNSVKHQAHDEGTVKIQEVGLINSISEKMQKIEKETKIKMQESQLNKIMLERQNEKERLNQEKSDREKAAVEKRNQLQKERLDWLTELANKRKKQEVKIQDSKREEMKEKELQAQRKREAREEKLRELNELEEERNKKLREKIKIKSATWEKRKNDVLREKREKAVEMGNQKSLNNPLYCSVEEVNNFQTPPKLGNRAKSLPASPRVDVNKSSSNLHKNKHVRNLFREENSLENNKSVICSKSLINVSPQKIELASGGGDLAESVLSHVSEEQTQQQATILSDPVSMYFMSEKSVENIKKMEEFERMLKKRLKKIKSRMNSRANKYEIDVGDIKLPPSANKNKINKALKEIEKVTQMHDPTIGLRGESTGPHLAQN